MNKVIFKDLGTISYKTAWDYQNELLKELVGVKVGNRKRTEEEKKPQKHYFLFCEHPHVYTLGRSGALSNLLLNDKGLQEKGVEFFKINRGGDITYHGYGQIVGYPILDLDYFFTDLHKYVRYLEEAVIRTLIDYGIEGGRIKGASGVWIDVDGVQPRKICAIGVHVSRWVTMHGFAFNINTDLDYFGYIVPCGITDKGVTSLSKELGREVDIDEVKEKVKQNFADLFGFEYVETEKTKEI